MAREAIFIGYRRDDTADVAGRVYDALARKFGRDRIFKDVDNLRPGSDFGACIGSLLPRCRVVLVLIGPNWLEARDETGRRRLDDPQDWVRIEIETALNAGGLEVVPVLVNGARMPRHEELPASLHPLLRRHAAIIRRDPDFRGDVERMVNVLRASIKSGSLGAAGFAGDRKLASRGRSNLARAWTGVALLTLAAGVWQFWPRPAIVGDEAKAGTDAPVLDGRWAFAVFDEWGVLLREESDCNSASVVRFEGNVLTITHWNGDTTREAGSIVGSGVQTGSGTYFREADTLVQRNSQSGEVLHLYVWCGP